jgi:hypothetical protein
VKELCTSLVNSQVLPSTFFTLKSQITPTFLLPLGVKMSELETSRVATAVGEAVAMGRSPKASVS